MKIGIDIDNVITNTTETVLHYINSRLPGVHLKMADVKEYWMEKIMPAGYGWIVPQAFSDKEMWKKVSMIDGAAEYIEKLFEQGNEIYFVTSTTPDNIRKKIKYLCRNLRLPDDYICNHFINIVNKQLLNLDVLVDDYLDNLLGGRDYFSICLDYPWNRNKADDGSFKRVYNWREIYDTIVELYPVYGNWNCRIP